MNNKLAFIGSFLVTLTVLIFAIVMPFSQLASYIVCMILPIGYIMMVAGLHNESDSEHKVASNIGLVFAGVYCTLIMIVYFAQSTSVNLESLTDQASKILDYTKAGLFFSYDLLGYGIMALSTFFIGLSIKAKNKVDKWLKALLMIHGIFFIQCFVMPMTGVFSSSTDNNFVFGVIALEFWCAYFLPIGILSMIHFRKK